MSFRKGLPLLLMLVLLIGCRYPFGMATSPTAKPPEAQAEQLRPLEGRVSFEPRAAQADLKDVAKAATVSLIDTTTNVTVAAAVTSANGQFSLVFPRTFRPDPAVAYYVEAIKGLNSNRPGSNTARIRTIVKYRQGDWTSLTVGKVGVTPHTTAIAIGAALRLGTDRPVDFDALLGKLSGATYEPVTNLSQADLDAILALVEQGLLADRDPVSKVGLNLSTGAWVEVAPSLAITGMSPTSATVGTLVTVNGKGFDPTPANNVLRFNGAPANAQSVSDGTLRVEVPLGATSGQTTLQVGELIALGPIFNVQLVVSGYAPISGSPGTSVTFTGSGFDASIPFNNTVTFDGVSATITQVTHTSITATVPTGALSGPVVVTVSGVSLSPGSFRVPVVISSMVPLSGVSGTSVTLTGSGFSPALAGNVVSFNGKLATIATASPTVIGVTVPAAVTTGPVTVTVAGEVGTTSPQNFVVASGLKGSATIQTLAGTTLPPAGRAATNWGITAGWVASDAAGNLYTNHGSKVYKIATNGVITHVAGTDTAGFSGDDGPATSAQLNSPQGGAVDSAGNLYIADYSNHRIRKVTPGGIITTVAGNGSAGYTGDGGAAVTTSLNNPRRIAIDSSNNLYIADTSNYRIRKVTPGGIISTIAGNGSSGSSGDGGSATAAQIGSIYGVAVDGAKNVYLADYGNWRIRKVTSGGIISTFAGTGSPGASSDGGAAASSTLYYVYDITADTTGNVYIADSNGSHRIRLVNTSGIISTIAGNGSPGYSGDGGAATSARINYAGGVAIDSTGNVYIADTDSCRIRKVTKATGVITTLAGITTSSFSGDAGTALTAQLASPQGVAVDSSNNVYIADTSNHRVRMVNTSGTITTYAGGVYNANYVTTSGYAGDGGAASAAQLSSPQGITLDGSGNVYIADSGNHRIRMVTKATGIMTTVAGDGNAAYTGDGLAATATSLKSPRGIAVDSSGNIYIADTGNHRIRKVTKSTGKISTLAGTGGAGYSGDDGPAVSAQLNNPYDVAVDAAGNVFIADTSNSRIRKVTPGGTITTVAGGGTSGDGAMAIAASLSSPRAIVLDTAGNLYVSTSSSVRKVDTSGTISTIVGGTSGFAGDAGAASEARLSSPYGLFVNGAGTILHIADTSNHRIRKVQ
ncbi:SBBP repeat-containing protein [bacterium]|nr:SBBP repeat-containing protein [bacterium]